MRVKEFVSLEKRLEQIFQEFAVKDQLMILQPTEHTLRGFHFDGSSFDKKSFYVNAFFMPLYVPAEQIHFTFGHRIRDEKGDRWSIEMPRLEFILRETMRKELEFLRTLQTLQGVAGALETLTQPNDVDYVNPHCYEAFAYTLAKIGDHSRALDVIEMLLKRANLAVAWENEIASRAQFIGATLRENPKKADAQLAAWAIENVSKLGLKNFISADEAHKN
ncbi:MAG TPA: hypothetical protein VJW20_13715 [Candidatus Angelobacter sp.]|nr:hypothetical protein [Candidatus Angelobacter sp.]